MKSKSFSVWIPYSVTLLSSFFMGYLIKDLIKFIERVPLPRSFPAILFVTMILFGVTAAVMIVWSIYDSNHN